MSKIQSFIYAAAIGMIDWLAQGDGDSANAVYDALQRFCTDQENECLDLVNQYDAAFMQGDGQRANSVLSDIQPMISGFISSSLQAEFMGAVAGSLHPVVRDNAASGTHPTLSYPVELYEEFLKEDRPLDMREVGNILDKCCVRSETVWRRPESQPESLRRLTMATSLFNHANSLIKCVSPEWLKMFSMDQYGISILRILELIPATSEQEVLDLLREMSAAMASWKECRQQCLYNAVSEMNLDVPAYPVLIKVEMPSIFFRRAPSPHPLRPRQSRQVCKDLPRLRLSRHCPRNVICQPETTPLPPRS